MFEIDKYSRTPIYEQVVRQIELMILNREVKENDQLPSVRTLSQTLSVNPNTLQRAYMELERRGICYSVPGSGRFIAAGALESLERMGDEFLDRLKEAAAELKRRGIDEQSAINAVKTVYNDDSAGM